MNNTLPKGLSVDAKIKLEDIVNVLSSEYETKLYAALEEVKENAKRSRNILKKKMEEIDKNLNLEKYEAVTPYYTIIVTSACVNLTNITLTLKLKRKKRKTIHMVTEAVCQQTFHILQKILLN